MIKRKRNFYYCHFIFQMCKNRKFFIQYFRNTRKNKQKVKKYCHKQNWSFGTIMKKMILV